MNALPKELSCIRNYLDGFFVRSDPYMPRLKEVHRQERKWCHRVRHDKPRRFNVMYAPVVIRYGRDIFTHPDNIHIFEDL